MTFFDLGVKNTKVQKEQFYEKKQMIRKERFWNELTYCVSFLNKKAQASF